MALLTEQPTTIATAKDVVYQLMRRFPKHVDTIEAWAPSYRNVLNALPPNRLKAVFDSVVDTWEYGQPPKPADFDKAARANNPEQALPTDPRARAEAERWKASLENGKRRDELAKRLVEQTRAAYSNMVDKAAAKWGIDRSHVERIMFLHLGKPYGTPESGSLAHKAATEVVFGGKDEPPYVELDTSDAKWAHYKHCATIYAQQERGMVELIPPGQHTVSKRVGEDPDEEDRRRQSIARADREAEKAERRNDREED